jgi:hypothetical protein
MLGLPDLHLQLEEIVLDSMGIREQSGVNGRPVKMIQRWSTHSLLSPGARSVCDWRHSQERHSAHILALLKRKMNILKSNVRGCEIET